LKKREYSPGWYGVDATQRRLQNNLQNAKFELLFSYGYFYVEVTAQNRDRFGAIVGTVQVLKVREVEVWRMRRLYTAHAAVKRYPGSRVEGSFTVEDVLSLLADQGNRCLGCECDITDSYTIDHIIPRTFSGSNNKSNIQLLCKSCNSSKGARSMDEWVAYKNAEAEAIRRGQTIGGITKDDDMFFELADWIKIASEACGMTPTQQILDMVKARKFVRAEMNEENFLTEVISTYDR
jgi:hypothetical protein